MSQLVIPHIDLEDPPEGGQFYTCGCGRSHMRVTTMLDKVIPKFALVPWAENSAIDACIEIYQDTMGLPPNRARVKEAIAERQMDAQSLKKAGAERGTVVHHYLNRYVATGHIESVLDFEPEHRPYLSRLAQFFMDYEPEFLASEVRLAHCELDYAGTTDGVCVIHRQPPRRNKPIDLTGKRVLFDAKSNKEGRVYAPEHLYQLAAYELAWRFMNGSPNDHQVVVALGRESYQLAVSYFEPESFEKLVAFYVDQARQMSLNPNAKD